MKSYYTLLRSGREDKGSILIDYTINYCIEKNKNTLKYVKEGKHEIIKKFTFTRFK
jgi:hypothetical protein